MEDLVVKTEETIIAKPIRHKKRHIRQRIKSALWMYAPEELLKLAEENGVKNTIEQDPEKWDKEEIKPGILVADLIVMKHIMKAIQGDEKSTRLLFSFGFGNPESTLNIRDDEDDENEIELQMSTEEKLEFIKRYNGTTTNEAEYREAISDTDSE
jgi:hypothetical protein